MRKAAILPRRRNERSGSASAVLAREGNTPTTYELPYESRIYREKERRVVQTDGQTFQSKKHDSGLKRANTRATTALSLGLSCWAWSHRSSHGGRQGRVAWSVGSDRCSRVRRGYAQADRARVPKAIRQMFWRGVPAPFLYRGLLTYRGSERSADLGRYSPGYSPSSRVAFLILSRALSEFPLARSGAEPMRLLLLTICSTLACQSRGRLPAARARCTARPSVLALGGGCALGGGEAIGTSGKRRAAWWLSDEGLPTRASLWPRAILTRMQASLPRR